LCSLSVVQHYLGYFFFVPQFLGGEFMSQIVGLTGLDRSYVRTAHKYFGLFLLVWGCWVLTLRILMTIRGTPRPRIAGLMGVAIRYHWYGPSPVRWS
jgi:hypothetical protein